MHFFVTLKDSQIEDTSDPPQKKIKIDTGEKDIDVNHTCDEGSGDEEEKASDESMVILFFFLFSQNIESPKAKSDKS